MLIPYETPLPLKMAALISVLILIAQLFFLLVLLFKNPEIFPNGRLIHPGISSFCNSIRNFFIKLLSSKDKSGGSEQIESSRKESTKKVPRLPLLIETFISIPLKSYWLILFSIIAIYLVYFSHHYIFEYSLKEQAFQHNEYVKQKYISLLDNLWVLRSDLSFKALENKNNYRSDEKKFKLDSSFYDRIEESITRIKNQYSTGDTVFSEYIQNGRTFLDIRRDIETPDTLKLSLDQLRSKTKIMGDTTLIKDWEKQIEGYYLEFSNAINAIRVNNSGNNGIRATQKQSMQLKDRTFTSNLGIILEQTSSLVTVSYWGHQLGRSIYMIIYAITYLLIIVMSYQYIKSEIYITASCQEFFKLMDLGMLDNYRKRVLDHALGAETIISNGLYVLITMGIIGTFLGLALAFYSASQSFPPTGLSASIADDNIKAMAVSGLIQTIYNYSYAILTSLVAYTISIVLRIGWRLSYNNPVSTFAFRIFQIVKTPYLLPESQIEKLKNTLLEIININIQAQFADIVGKLNHCLKKQK